MNKVEAYLYDAKGEDEEIDLKDFDPKRLGEKQLLWVNVLTRDQAVLESVTRILQVDDVPCQKVLDDSGYLEIEKYENFFRFCVDSVVVERDAGPEKKMVDFIVGKNFVVTVHDGEIEYFKEFRKREKGETQFGELDAESFVATLLDLNIISYFLAVNEIERRVDEIDERVLKTELETDEFLKDMVRLRRDVTKLRRWLMPHREIFYSLSRADFQQIAESGSAEQYKMLSQHFETAVDAVEHARETVLGVFELYATKSSQMTNTFVQRLTFLTLLTGSLAVFAGILGMNFKASIFEAENGFWITVSGLVAMAATLTVFARYKRWI